METPNLPYLAEYSKSGRAGCKQCKKGIDKDTLRLAVMVQSPFFDGLAPKWHHFDCFFVRYHPRNVGEIKNYEMLKYDDQKKIDEMLMKKQVPETQKNNRKRKVKVNTSQDFFVEYSKSNRAACISCTEKIEKDEIRIGKLDDDSDEARRIGPFKRWFHVDCFQNNCDDLGFISSVESLNGFDALKSADQKKLQKKILSSSKIVKSQTKVEEDEKQPKVEENCVKKESNKEDKALKKQSDLIHRNLEMVKSLTKIQIYSFFIENGVEEKNIPDDFSCRKEFLADALVFGWPKSCDKCGGCFIFNVWRYVCSGNYDEWTRCTNEMENPPRSKVKFFDDKIRDQFKYKFIKRQRLVNEMFKSKYQKNLLEKQIKQSQIKNEPSDNDEQEKGVLSGYIITYLGKEKLVSVKNKIEKLGAKYRNEINPTILCVVSSENHWHSLKKTKKIKTIEEMNIPVVSEDFFTNVSNPTISVQKALLDSKITFWDLDEDEITKRLEKLNSVSNIKSAFKSGSGKSQSKSQKVVIKDGIAVYPESELQDSAHVYKKGNDIYSVVLNLVDVNTNKNSYYKMQLLQNDKNDHLFFLFKSWGRIGTEIGNTKLENYYNLGEATDAFKRSYFERTSNHWSNRHNFVKHPNSYYPVDIDYNDTKETSQVIKVEESKSLLPLQVKELIALLFDIQNMKRTMMEFELDLEKMPLGKLSKKRILEACETLKYISDLLERKPIPQNELVGACNKFYSLVPHNFGMEKPPLITSSNMISTKNEMLESLLEIELAYEIISNNENSNTTEDALDFNYRKFKSEIIPISKNDDDYKLIEKYIQNTHAKTHNVYTLEIINIFRLNREGEAERFAKFADNPNRMLLWHGSRLTNFVGIISQGLRIAPKEAPATGYMFGKGVYFADSVSKSANYCYTSYDNSIGLLALSEVAIGNSKELINAEYVDKLPKKYQSVKGIGQSYPNPEEMVITADGVKVPLGKMINNTNLMRASLLYNEYIVYNEEQIKMKYLIQVRFNYKNLF